MLSLANVHWVVVTTRVAASSPRPHVRCEDAIGAALLPDGGCALAVADGVGSGALGDVCSAAALAHSLAECVLAAPRAWQVHSILAGADAAVRAALEPHTCARGATTLVGAWLDSQGAGFVGHCGDSRAYLARIGASPPRMHRLTQDHSYRNLGLPTPLAGSPDDPARMLGLGCCDASDVNEFRVSPGDVVLLCTDGVHAHVPADWLQGSVLQAVGRLRGMDLEGAAEVLATLAQSLVAHARLHRSRDDASIALAWRRGLSNDAG
ncbi:MAG: protein phosphatase [Ramlibacter sp.]|nr:protein phosphatase [Ramlibacter sp.]